MYAKTIRSIAAAVTICLSLTLFSASVEAQFTFRTVAFSGLPAPGTNPGISFGGFLGDFVISRDGSVAFTSGLEGPGSGGDDAIFYEDDGTLKILARTGDQAPGLSPGVTFLRLNILSAGQPLMRASLTGPGISDSNNQAIYSLSDGSLELIASSGAPAAFAGSGVNFGPYFGTRANENGQFIAFNRLIKRGFPSTRGSVIFGDSEGVEAVATTGSPAPGAGLGVTFNFSTIFSDGSALNNAGDSAIQATLSSGSGIFSNAGGSLQAIALEGTTAPGTPLGTTYEPFTFTGLSLNDQGDISFAADLSGGSRAGVFASSDGVVRNVARAGASVPGGFGILRFGEFGDQVINAKGQVALVTELENAPGLTLVTSLNDTEILFENADHVLQPVARENQEIPGVTDASVLFSDLRFVDILTNKLGQLAFRSALRGPGVDGDSDLGVFFYVNDSLQTVVRTNDMFDVNDDPDVADLRRITFISFLFPSSGGEDGNRSRLSDTGDLLFSLSFDDGSRGVFVARGPACLLGDVDVSGTVDFSDIAPFIAVLSGGGFQCEADCDESGVVDFSDIAPFIAILSGG